MTPRIRQTIYLVGTVISGVIGVALLWGGISTESASSVGQLVAGFVALLGGAAPAVAAKTVGKQIHNGSFDSDPADQVIKGLEAVVAARSEAQLQIDRVKEAVSAAVNEVPVFGPLAKQALENIF